MTLSAVTFIMLAVLSSSCSFVEAKGSIDNEFFQLLPLSAAQPTTINVLLAFIVIGIVLVALAFLHALRRHWKKIAVALLVVVAVMAGFYAVWSSEASISYWLVAPDTTATEDNYLTMYCENTGRLTGTFDLELAFTNAHFSQKTSLPYQLIDNRTLRFTFTLKSGETQSRQMWFIIDNNVSDFYIYLSFKQNGASFLVRSSSGGVDSVSYQKDTNDGNFTMRVFAPLP